MGATQLRHENQAGTDRCVEHFDEAALGQPAGLPMGAPRVVAHGVRQFQSVASLVVEGLRMIRSNVAPIDADRLGVAEPRTYSGFSAAFNDQMKRLRIDGAAFGDARCTTVTRLRRAGASNAEIGAITGHSNAEISSIVEKHYAAWDPVLADQAIAELAACYAATRKA